MAQEVIEAILPHNRAEVEELVRLSVVTALWTAFAAEIIFLLS
jgi:hypothetical protein